jgi:O-acetyl-ADP-ribose deacetylase
VATALRPLQFKDTTIALVHGQPMDHLSEGLYSTVNARAVMATGLAGAIRLSGGPEIERELRAVGDLLVGRAYVTGPGRLAKHGLLKIAHGITTPQPGMAPNRAPVQAALSDALDLLDREGIRTLTLPEIGMRIPGIAIDDAAAILASHLASALRRRSKLREVTIVGLDPGYLSSCASLLEALGATRS